MMAEKNTETSTVPVRLVSLDAYRGFVMLAMASSGLGLAAVCRTKEVVERYDHTGFKNAWHWMCEQVAFHTGHVAWGGCAFWDLIQPSFMFMVGVALPFSFASRASLGQSGFMQFLHVIKRSAVLILLGMFLRSNGAAHTNFFFVDVLTQIGLGYPIVWLLLKKGTVLQLLASAAILGGYWYAFYQHPAPPAGFNPTTVGLPADWPVYHGLAAHWNRHTNWATSIDQQLMNLFPHYDKSGTLVQFKYYPGGYQTLNFIPSIVTMIFGLMAGELLYGQKSPQEKTRRLLGTGLLSLAAGLALDPRMVSTIPFVPTLPLDWTLCPIVKVIWTPSWVLFSSGITLWMLAGFYWIIDVKGFKTWAFPMVIVGMNSIAMYIGAALLKPWIVQTLKTHICPKMFDYSGGKTVELAATLFVLWLMCLWMYRRKIFVRI